MVLKYEYLDSVKTNYTASNERNVLDTSKRCKAASFTYVLSAHDL